MFTKLICAMLIIATTQALPSLSDREAEKNEPLKELPCLEKIAWYRSLTNSTKYMYDDYIKSLRDAPMSNHTRDIVLDVAIKNYESTYDVMLPKYDSYSIYLDAEKDNATRERLCSPIVDNCRSMYIRLTRTLISLKYKVARRIKDSGVSEEVTNAIRKLIDRPINYLLVAGFRESTYNDTKYLLEEVSDELTKDGVEMNLICTFDENGVVDWNYILWERDYQSRHKSSSQYEKEKNSIRPNENERTTALYDAEFVATSPEDDYTTGWYTTTSRPITTSSRYDDDGWITRIIVKNDDWFSNIYLGIILIGLGVVLLIITIVIMLIQIRRKPSHKTLL